MGYPQSFFVWQLPTTLFLLVHILVCETSSCLLLSPKRGWNYLLATKDQATTRRSSKNKLQNANQKQCSTASCYQNSIQDNNNTIEIISNLFEYMGVRPFVVFHDKPLKHKLALAMWKMRGTVLRVLHAWEPLWRWHDSRPGRS